MESARAVLVLLVATAAAEEESDTLKSDVPSPALASWFDPLSVLILGVVLFLTYYYLKILQWDGEFQKARAEEARALDRSTASEAENDVFGPDPSSPSSGFSSFSASPTRTRSSQSMSFSSPSETMARARSTSLGEKMGHGSVDDSDSQHADDELEESGTDLEGGSLDNSKNTSSASNTTLSPKDKKSGQQQQQAQPRQKRRKSNRERNPSKSLHSGSEATTAALFENTSPIVNEPYKKPPRTPKGSTASSKENVTPAAAGDMAVSSTEDDEQVPTGNKESPPEKDESHFYIELGLPIEEIYERLHKHLVNPKQLQSEGFLVPMPEGGPGVCSILKTKPKYIPDPDQVGDTEEENAGAPAMGNGNGSGSVDPLRSPRASRLRSNLNVNAKEFQSKNSPSIQRKLPSKSASNGTLANTNASDPILINNNVATGTSEASPSAGSPNTLTRVGSLNVDANEFVPGMLTSPPSSLHMGCEQGPGMHRAHTSPNMHGLAAHTNGYQHEQLSERKCVRCYTVFKVNHDLSYPRVGCSYHHGKKIRDPPKARGGFVFDCCGGSFKRGCTQANYHVWSGLVDGLNIIEGCVSASARPFPADPSSSSTRVPLEEAVSTNSTNQDAGSNSSSSSSPFLLARKEAPHRILAIDCEMGYTFAGLELIQLTVLDITGRPLYRAFVYPDRQVIDYNTRFSGVTSKDLFQNPTRSLVEVQQEVLALMTRDTILIGHGLENDLRALKLAHFKVLDTALHFLPKGNNGRRQSLKALVKEKLSQDIQINDGSGHNSYEDARACVDLVLWMLKDEVRREKEEEENSINKEEEENHE